jgi:hypothetical protein
MRSLGHKPKAEDAHEKILRAWYLGKIRINSTAHAKTRSDQRAILITDLRDVILYGQREEEKDKWRSERGHWTYAIRNMDVDGRDIRAIFDIEQYPNVIVVTLMHVYP